MGAMSTIETVFATSIYRAPVTRRPEPLVAALAAECRQIARDDAAGRAWSREHGYKGYTSYASLADLTWRSPIFAELKELLDGHVATFARALDFDLQGGRLVLDNIWINVLEPGGSHSAHVHPHSVVSGTCYVVVPPGASAIRFEDPRLAMMMAAPMRRATARRANRTFLDIAPRPGTVLLWESWLRHEVPLNRAREPRISVSFNYAHRGRGERPGATGV